VVSVKSKVFQRARKALWLYSAAAHGRSEAKDVEVEARQAPRAARAHDATRPGLPDV
jgi:hypothetical protein